MKFPDGYQVLCWNCNSAKHFQGECQCQGDKTLIYVIENTETGEYFTLTEDKLRLMLENSPDENTRELFEDQILVGNHIELDSSHFATICYLAARTWLGGETRPS